MYQISLLYSHLLLDLGHWCILGFNHLLKKGICLTWTTWVHKKMNKNNSTSKKFLTLKLLNVFKYANSVFLVITYNFRFVFKSSIIIILLLIIIFISMNHGQSIFSIFFFLDRSSLDLPNEDDEILISTGQIIQCASLVYKRELKCRQVTLRWDYHAK